MFLYFYFAEDHRCFLKNWICQHSKIKCRIFSVPFKLIFLLVHISRDIYWTNIDVHCYIAIPDKNKVCNDHRKSFSYFVTYPLRNPIHMANLISVTIQFLSIKVKIAVMLLLVKCYKNKMVKSPGCSSKGMLPCG